LGEVAISYDFYVDLYRAMCEQGGYLDENGDLIDENNYPDPSEEVWKFRDLENALNASPYQNIPNLYSAFPDGLEIVGIFDDRSSEHRAYAYMSSESFAVLQESLADYSGPIYGFGARSQIAKVLSQNSLLASFAGFDAIYASMSWRDNGSFTIGFSTLSAISLALGVFLTILFGNSEISSREKDIAILRSFGHSAMKVTAIVSSKNAAIIVLATILGIIGGILGTSFINSLFRNSNPVMYSFELMHVEWYVPVLLVAINVLVFLVTMFISYRVLKKKNIADSLRLL